MYIAYMYTDISRVRDCRIHAQESSQQTYSLSDCQEMYLLVWKPDVYCHVRNSLPVDPILSQIKDISIFWGITVCSPLKVN
jgi:hypothetical protein